MDTLAISVRRALSSDAAALAALVNRAYAVERAFVDGDRTSADEIVELIRRGAFLVLEHADGLAAAIYIERRAAGAYFGLLSVDPGQQGIGLGTRLVRIAEAYAEAMGAATMSLKIVNLREELLRWYRGLGYREVGTTAFGRPAKRACHFIELRKLLGAAEAVHAHHAA